MREYRPESTAGRNFFRKFFQFRKLVRAAQANSIDDNRILADRPSIRQGHGHKKRGTQPDDAREIDESVPPREEFRRHLATTAVKAYKVLQIGLAPPGAGRPAVRE